MKPNDPRFAIRTSDKSLNTLGIGDGAGMQKYAQLFITTQQKLSHLAQQAWHRNFENDAYFHFNGTTRQVRVWDEAMVPIHPVTLTVGQIKHFAVELGLRFPRLEAVLMDWARELGKSKSESTSFVPTWWDPLKQAYGDVDELPDEINELASVGWALRRIQGNAVNVHVDGNSGAVAVTYREALPKNFAPVLILAAFGHDRKFYRLWAERRGDLAFLKFAGKDYSNLTIHVVDIAAGKRAHSGEASREKIVAAGKAAHFEAGAPLLNVIHKPGEGQWSSYDVEKEMRAAITAAGGDPDRDAYVTWGFHTGRNDFLDRKHEFIGGPLRRPVAHYKSIGMGATRCEPGEHLDIDELDELILTNVAQDLQQAAGRIAIRMNVNGGVPEGTHLWVASPLRGSVPFSEEWWERTFPGARL